MAYDAINPAHYAGVLVIPKDRVADFTQEDGSISLQYMDVMEFMLSKEEYLGHLKGQTYKYMMRLGKKDNNYQELGKASWYLQRLRSWFK